MESMFLFGKHIARMLLTISLGVVFVISSSGQEVIVSSIEKLNSEVNSETEEVFPLMSNDHSTLYFVRSFHDDNIGGKNSGQDIWYVTRDSTGNWTDGSNLSVLNTPYNNAIVGMSADDQTLFLLNTYSNPNRWKYGVCTSSLEQDGWSIPKEVPLKLNGSGELKGYYVTPDEKILLVSSNNENSFGNEDLYLYRLDGLEKQFEPYHFSENINTEGAEISPFLSPDQKILFFASDGHEGLGGFDIYYCIRLEDDWEHWSSPVNLGNSVNSPDFEAFLSTYEDGTAFFVSNKNGTSTDIYSAKLEIALRTNDMLARSAALNERFKEILIMDTTIRFNIGHVSEVTSDLSQNFEKLLDGAGSMNRGMFGVGERDSIINENVMVQEMTKKSSDEFATLRLHNTALSQDIQSIQVFNKKVLDYIDRVVPKIANKANNQQAELMRVLELKKSIGHKLGEIADQKQELTELITNNAFLKTTYSLDLKNRQFTADGVDQNNDQIEVKLHAWTENLDSLNFIYSDLIEATSNFHVYITDNNNDILMDNSINQEFAKALAMDTSVNRKIAKLTSKIPELTSQVGDLLEGNETLDDRLFGVNARDSLLNKNLNQLSGVERDSKGFNQINDDNNKFNLEIQDMVAQNTSLHKQIVDQAATAFNDRDSTQVPVEIIRLEKDLPTQIAKGALLKQGISELILKNADLKTQLAKAKDGGDSLVQEIKANNVLIRSAFEKWKEAMLALEKSASNLETVSQYRNLSASARKVLFGSTLLSDRMKSTLGRDDQLTQELGAINENSRHPKEYIQNNTTHNHQMLGTHDTNIEINSNFAKLDSLSPGSRAFKNTILNNQMLGDKIGQLSKASNSSRELLVEPYPDSPENLNSTSARLLFDLNKDISGIVGKNAGLKHQIVQLIDENADLKEQYFSKDHPEKVVAKITENNELMDDLFDGWNKNMNLLEDKMQQLREAKAKDLNADDVFRQSIAMDQRFQKILSSDATISGDIVSLSDVEQYLNPLVTDIASLNDNHSQNLNNLTQLDVSFNERLVGSSGQTVDSRDLNLGIEQKISALLNQNDANVLDKMALKVADTILLSANSEFSDPKLEIKREFTVLLAKNAVLKQDIGKLIYANAGMKNQLAATTPIDSSAVLTAIVATNDTIRSKLRQLQANLQLLKDKYMALKDQSVELVATNRLSANMKPLGYAVQLIAMPRNMNPQGNFFRRVTKEEVKMANGRDGLDRYYIGHYKNKNDALRAMKKLRKNGYSDAFVRAIVKYSIL